MRRTRIGCVIALAVAGAAAQAAEFYVAPNGSDKNPGTRAQPLATLGGAQQVVRSVAGKEPVTVYLRSGTYYLPETLVFTSRDSGTKDAPVVYAAFGNEKPVISGGAKLDLTWTEYKNGIMKASVPATLTTDQLFVNGRRQHMARYPNYDPNARYFNGFAADCFGKERAARWADPAGGFIHAMHRSHWGDFHYVITGKDAEGNVTYEGGWQNNRRMGMHQQHRFVENIFEELDAPGEWFLDSKKHVLYFMPPAALDLDKALIETASLKHLIEFRGSEDAPVRFVTLKGLTFRHTARTFMDNKEPLLRSDWTTYRGGAIFVNGAEDCAVTDCYLDAVGGNGIFVNKYNRRITITGCKIAEAGASGVCFVGDPAAVRSPLFEYGQRQTFEKIEKQPGPKTNNYPAQCRVEDCLIYRSGRFEKQTAGVQISMASEITVRHCSIYDVPRAGINISEGTWGGHLLEFNDVFDTVKETGDHGSFNSWGRDRYWGLKDVDLQKITLGAQRDLPLLDAVKTTVIRNNRWRCDHGWDIDLDDGSSNYHIYNNLCLNGGIKLREGFYRVCENNIMVNNSFHPHVWYQNSEDVFRRNIVFGKYRPIRVPKPWGKQVDLNLLHAPGQYGPADVLMEQSGRDRKSVVGGAMFLNPGDGDYRIGGGSQARELGFKNFPMDKFGVQKPELKAEARTPELPTINGHGESAKKETTITWLGATIKNLTTESEKSATGMHAVTGVYIVDVPAESKAAAYGLQANDVIIAVSGPVREYLDLSDMLNGRDGGDEVTVTVWRNQSEHKISWKYERDGVE